MKTKIIILLATFLISGCSSIFKKNEISTDIIAQSENPVICLAPKYEPCPELINIEEGQELTEYAILLRNLYRECASRFNKNQ